MRKINLTVVAAVVGLVGCIAQVAGLAIRDDLADDVSNVEAGMKSLAGPCVVGLLLWHPKN